MRISLIVLLTAVAVGLLGCSGGGGMPVTPGIPGGDTTDFGEDGELRMGNLPDAGNFLWGYWQGTIDLASNEIELLPMRQVEFHANLASILQDHPLGLTYKFKGFDMIEKAVDVDVTITHPYPNSNFRGFDTRGIFMGPGSKITSQTDPGIKYPALDGTRVLNADGYTRWWNAIEFTSAGMYGYDENIVFADFIVPETTLNPYKYFADCLEAQDPVIPNVNPNNRGTFSTEGTPPSVTRRYRIQFPTIGGYMKFVFHYAVDVSWAAPINGHPTPKPIEDFPMDANCPEPFHIEVDTTGSTAFYKNEYENGGDLQLALEIFDWQAEQNPQGIDGEIESIWLESETLFDPIYITNVVPISGSYANSGIYEISIPDVTPSGFEDQEILITVRSSDPNTYAPPISGPAYPESAMLASYALVKIPVSDVEIADIHLLSPNGDDILMAGASCSIEWETSPYAEIEKVSLLLSTNSGAEYGKGIALNITNTGSYVLYNIPEEYIGCHNRIKVLDANHPSVYDVSDSDFTILPQLEDQILVTVPNGGEDWIAGTCEDIKWVADQNIPNVTIKFSEDMGQTWPVTITESTPNPDGVFNWGPMPQEYISPNCRIGVFDANNPGVFDISDSNFTISEPGVELLTPNGGEVLEVGNACEITWKASDIITDILIEMSLDSGATYPYEITASTPNTGNYIWDPIDDWPQTFNGRIKLSDVSDPGAHNDESDADFSLMGRSITLSSPLGGEEWRLGHSQTVEWNWTGVIPFVDISMSVDGGDFDEILVEDYCNTGLLEIASFFPDSLTQDHNLWEDFDRVISIKVEASDNPALFDTSDGDIIVPITLGVVDDKNDAAFGDNDNDGVKDDVETFLEMNLEGFDSDRDGMYDFKELFNPGGWDWSDLIPDQDNDGIIAPLDKDDNNDGNHDGELVDSDLDGIPNYLEYYGYTYNWLSGEFLLWDEDGIDPDFTVDYHKTDPMQPSSDQDPYSDGMETSGLFMDQSVEKPGNSPMIPACPDIVVSLENYKVTLNADITDSEGGSESEGRTWGRETSKSSTSSMEHHWEVEVGVETECSITGGTKVSVKASAGGSYSSSNTSSTSTSTGESVTETWDWSTTRSTNPTEAAVIKLYLKVRNRGSACASNIIPTFTLIIGNHQVATFEQGNAQINLLPPGGVYPAASEVYWVVDSIDTGAGVSPIYLTLTELKALESGAPVSIEVTQMLASVAAMNDQGYWEYVGDWGEYMSRVDAVSANIFIEKGDGSPINYRVYADDDPSSPEVTLGDALIWAAGLREEGDSLIVDYKLDDGSWNTLDLDGCRFMFDDATWTEIQNSLVGNTFLVVDIPLTPGCAVVGKMPPDPAFEKPTVHQAGYDEETGILYAIASDYYAVTQVDFVDISTGTIPMSYDGIDGCYTLALDPDTFVLDEGNDYVVATNISGSLSDPFPVKAIAAPPDPDPDPPVITNATYEIHEYIDHLAAIITANVTGESTITEVFLLGATDEILGQLEYVSGDTYVYEFEIDPDFQPAGTERIRAYDDKGKSATVWINPEGYHYPAHMWQPYQLLLFTYDYSWDYYWLWDIDSLEDVYCDDNYWEHMNEEHDLAIHIDDGDTWYYGAANPLMKYKYMGQWASDPPSREYMKSLYDAGLFQTYVGNAVKDPAHTLTLFTTGEGRLTYMLFSPCPPSAHYQGYLGVYSLYNGPWEDY